MEQADYNQNSSEKSTTNSSFINKVLSPFKIIFGFVRRSRLMLIVVCLLLFAFIAFVGIQQSTANPSDQQVLQPSDTQVDLEKPVLEKKLNKTFSFPLTDQEGREVSKLNYTIDSVELRNHIIVKGQQVSAIEGKTFLIINIKLTNNYDKTVQVNAKDYLRVSVGTASEKLAPDMHSDPVEVQAISTKPTRLGMAINESDKHIILQVGEIAGKKESVVIDL